MKNKKILIGPSSFAELDSSPLRKLGEFGFQIVGNPFKRKITREEIAHLLSDDVTGLIAGLETLDRTVLEHSRLEVISRCGAGMSNVDTDAAKELGILVYSTPFGPTQAVAEITLGCLLSLIRELSQMNIAMHGGKWDKRIGRQLKGMTILIIGYGRIGRAVANLLSAFETKILVYDPACEKGNTQCSHMDIANALPLADVITLHASGQKQIIGRHEFSLMKQGVFVLNASRGELIDENALMEALDTKKVTGAWLDTFRREPYDGPLTAYNQVILTPHIGSYTYEGRLQMEMEAVDNLIRGFTEKGQGT